MAELGWTRENLAWAAGIFEGEGCINHFSSKNPRSCRLQLYMTDLDVMERFCQIAGVGEVELCVAPSRLRGGRKPIYVWRISNWDEWYPFAVAMWPWLGERRRAALKEAIERWITPTNPCRGFWRCKNDHVITIETMVKSSDGGRRCLLCARERNAAVAA